jgi:GDPmannose 4,6-dehydratase
MHASNGILFNHESPIRGETFATRKISRGAARIVLGMQDCLYMGNLSARRDWGHAKDYIRAMYLMLQQEKPDDYVIATGVSTSIREFIQQTFASIGVVVAFSGEKENETGSVDSIYEPRFKEMVGKEHLLPFLKKIKESPVIVKVDRNYFRPTEVDELVGNPAKAMIQLGWRPEYDLTGLIVDMIKSDIHLMKRETYLKNGGFRTFNYFE